MGCRHRVAQSWTRLKRLSSRVTNTFIGEAWEEVGGNCRWSEAARLDWEILRKIKETGTQTFLRTTWVQIQNLHLVEWFLGKTFRISVSLFPHL